MRPHRRERLASLLWPSGSESSARRNLRHALTDLRRLLGDGEQPAAPYLAATRQMLQLCLTTDCSVDVPRFLTLLQADQPGTRAPTEDLVQATDLCRGSFMEGFSLPGCPEFEEWIVLTRERLQ